MSPKMSARSGLAGKKTFPALFGDIPGYFSMDRNKNRNGSKMFNFPSGPTGPIHLVWEGQKGW